MTCVHAVIVNGVCSSCGACNHQVRMNGRCQHCGDCEHSVLLNGACEQCGIRPTFEDGDFDDEPTKDW
jgi:hypothetical protein